MWIFHEFELSRMTLLVVMLLPFIYYSYQAKFWYLPERLKLLDIIVSSGAIGLSILVAIKIAVSAKVRDSEQIQYALLHIGPLALTLMAMSRDRKRGTGLGVPNGPVAPQPSKSESDYAPRARNADVEELSWDDIIIDDSTRDELQSVITLLKDPSLAKDYGIAVPKGILLNGPPGTGKTTIAKVVANMAGLSFFVLRANEIVSKWVGESEKNLTKLFETAQANTPAVIFIDEIDTLGKKRSEGNAAHSDSLLNHLLQLIDGVVKAEGVYVIGATNRGDLVDEALRRAGRLNRIIEIPLPDLEGRKKLFGLYLSKLKTSADVDLEALAEATDGNSGADIKALCSQGGLNAFQREKNLPEKSRRQIVTSADLEAALSLFVVEGEDDEDEQDDLTANPQPVNGQIEKIGWRDIIVDDSLKQELQSVVTLLKDPETATRYGIAVPKGILLNGPPGTGKTTLAKVIANEANLSFFVLQVEDIVSKWVGESEKNLTRFFKTATKHAPAVIFIDEVDSIGKSRSDGSAAHADNLLNHMLQLIDGVIKREGIYIIAATNRADLVDSALKRGGRLNKVIQIPLPGPQARSRLFELYLKKLPLEGRVDFGRLAGRTENKSAADIKEICNQAGLNAFKRESGSGSRNYVVSGADLEEAIAEWSGQ